MCWYGKKDCGWNTYYTTNVHDAYKQNPTTFCLPYTYPLSLHKSNETSPDMAPTSPTSDTFQTTSTTASPGTSPSTTNDVLYIKHFVALASLNKLETKSINQDIA